MKRLSALLVAALALVATLALLAMSEPSAAQRRGPNSFLAIADAAPITGLAKVAFGTERHDTRGIWDTENARFTAPSQGVFHFDLGLRIDHRPPALSCAYVFTLRHSRGESQIGEYELFQLEQSTVDVGDSPSRSVMRQTAWRLRDSAGIDLGMRRGDTLEVWVAPSNALCHHQASIVPSTEARWVGYLSAHQVGP